MSTYLVKLYGNNNTILREITVVNTTTELHISDTFVSQLLDQYEVNDEVMFFELFLFGDYNIVTAKDFTMYQKINVFGNKGNKTRIRHFLCDNVNIHAVDFEVHNLQINKGSLYLANSSIEELYYDINNLRNDNRDNNNQDENNDYKLEIKNTSLNGIKIFGSLDYFLLQNCLVNQLQFTSLQNREITVNNFQCNLHTKIKVLTLGCKFNSINFEDTNIEKLYFSSLSAINNINMTKSEADSIFRCKEAMFSSLGITEYEMLKSSSINDDDYPKYYYYSYKLEDIRYKNEKSFGKWFLKVTTGYSFIPRKAIAFTLVTISLFAILYSINDFILFLCNDGALSLKWESIKYSINCFIDRIYFSGIAFTTVGFRDIEPMSIFVKLLSVFESALGIITFALLVHSLTTRYLRRN